MNILKASFYTGISTGIKILTGLLVVKCIAVFIGPNGMGKMGQFISLMTCLTVLAGGGIGNGVIKFVAEFRQSDSKIKSIIGNAIIFTLSCSFITAFLCLIFRNNLSLWLLGSNKYTSIIVILGLAQFLIGFNNFLVAIVNGFNDIKRLAALNIVGNLVGVLMMIWLIKTYNLYGGLLGLIAMQSVLFFVTLFYVIRSPWFHLSYFKPNYDFQRFIELAKFSMMSITTAIVLPVAQIIIRTHVQYELSWTEVGYWQAISRISDVYLLFITTTLIAYYLPKMSAINNTYELRAELIKTYKTIIPFVIALALLIYVFRDFIIFLLFTPAFAPMKTLFAFQLIGDVIKIAAFPLSYLMLAKAMTKTFIATEIIFTSTLVINSFIFLHYFGLVGLTYAFAFNFFLYFITMILIGKKFFFVRKLKSVVLFDKKT